MLSLVRLRPTIVLFGDSLTQYAFGRDGWASLLADAYVRRADVLNRGFSGYNTRHALDVLPRVFGQVLPDDDVEEDHKAFDQDTSTKTLLCTVLLGANDSALPGQRQHVPLEEYQENMKEIISLIRKRMEKDDVPIILMTPPPLDAPAWDSNCPGGPGSRSNDVTRAYGQVVKEVATQMNCPVLDVFELLGGNGDDFGKHLSDGLHLAASGNALIFEGLMELVIQREFPHLAPMQDGDGRYGTSGIPMEEKLWAELC